MEDWLGELEPQAQRVLRQAQEAVARRGGYAISVEDVLLALLELSPSFPEFLSRHGVDMDELFRTVQCEQPIVALSSECDGLSTQVVYWLATALETGETPLRVSHLLETLVCSCERLSQRAYVAVLEQVPHHAWQELAAEADVFQRPPAEGIRPLASDAALGLSASESAQSAARTLLGMTMTAPVPVLELQAPSMIQCRSLVQRLMLEFEPCLGRQVSGLCVSAEALTSAHQGALVERLERTLQGNEATQILLLEGVTPDLLAALVRKEGVLGWQKLLQRETLIPVLAHRPASLDAASRNWLEAQFGRSLRRFHPPSPKAVDVLGYLQRCRPMLEAELQTQVDGEALALAACYSDCTRTIAGDSAIRVEAEMLNESADLDRAWSILHSAAAMARAQRICGPARLNALKSQWHQSRQQELVALARPDEPAGILPDGQLSMSLAAEEVNWLESTTEEPPVVRAATVADWLRKEAAAQPGTRVRPAASWARSGA